jgi:hypothetical protein
MTVFVEANIVRKFLKSSLASNFLAEMNVLKNDFGNYELGLPVILRVHILSFTCDVSHTVIVSDSELLEVLEKLVSFCHQSSDVCLHVDILVIVAQVLPVQAFKLSSSSVDVLQCSCSFVA